MSNHHLRNKELSLKAKGLLSQMLSLPEDWDYTLKGYWPTHSQQKFCSEECKKINHNKKTLEFYHKKQKEKTLCKDE